MHQNPLGKKLPRRVKVCKPIYTLRITLRGRVVLFACQVSSASQSSSSLAGSHLSPSGPSPCHRTRYWICLCLVLSSTIFSMKNSCSPLTSIGLGGLSAREGKRLLSFSLKGETSEEWKTGNALGAFGMSRVTVECFWFVARMRYGPSNRGMNFATQSVSEFLYSCRRLAVERTTR